MITSNSLLNQNWPKNITSNRKLLFYIYFEAKIGKKHFFKQKIQGNHLIQIHFEAKSGKNDYFKQEI